MEAVARKSPRAAFPLRSRLWGQTQKDPSWNWPLGSGPSFSGRKWTERG